MNIAFNRWHHLNRRYVVLSQYSRYAVEYMTYANPTKQMENMQMYECVSIYAIAYVIISEWDKTDLSI